MSRQTIEQRVARGIALLDEKGPEGWRERVNLDRLDIRDPRRCVLGQTYDLSPSGVNGYRIGRLALGLSREGATKTYGFNVYDGEWFDERLSDEWRRQLRQVPR